MYDAWGQAYGTPPSIVESRRGPRLTLGIRPFNMHDNPDSSRAGYPVFSNWYDMVPLDGTGTYILYIQGAVFMKMVHTRYVQMYIRANSRKPHLTGQIKSLFNHINSFVGINHEAATSEA